MFAQMRNTIFGILFCLSGTISNKLEFNVTGLIPAVLTALNDDNTVDITGIPAYVGYLVDNGIKAVLVGGSSGEHMFLSVDDRKRIIDAWVNASYDTNLHVQVQVGGAPFPDVVDLATYCSASGVNSILTLPDLYSKPKTVEDLVFYVEQVARAAPNLPVFYYHIPKKSKVDVHMPEFVAAASVRIPNFQGIKFTSYDLVEAAQVLNTLQDNQRIFLGGEHLLAPAALLGINSCMSPAINLFPGLMQNILDAVENGYVVKVREWQQKLSDIVNEISAEGGRIPAMKLAMEILTGIKMGPPALPAKPMSNEDRSRIEEKLRNFRY